MVKKMLRKEVEERIQAKVQKHYDYLVKRIPAERVIGVFAYGSMNYGFYEDGVSDVDTKAVILPSLSDIVQGKKLKSKELILSNGEHCVVKDIRLYVQQLKKQNICFVETLYTTYCVINPMWEHLWGSYFIEQRCGISRYDTYLTIQAAGNQLLSTKGRKGKDVYNIIRLSLFIERYYLGYGYSACINPSFTLSEKTRNDMWKYKKQKNIDFSNDTDTIALVNTIRKKVIYIVELSKRSSTDTKQEINNKRTIDNILTECVTLMLISVFNNGRGQSNIY